MPQPPDRIAGALLVGAACLCWSSGGILVRLLDLDVIVFWRSLFMAVACWSFIEARGSLSSLPSEGPGCYPAFCLAAHIVVLRRWRSIDMVPAAMLGGLISEAVTAPWAIRTPVVGSDFMILATSECVQLGLGLFLFVRGSRKLRAGELGLLTSLEPILASIWVWIGIGKTPSATALLGGSILLAAVIGLTASEHLLLLPPTAAKQSR